MRVIRACRELGISPITVYSDADRTALHVRLADEAYSIGPAPATESYLRSANILAAAKMAGAAAIHPGYGFLSESAAFARECAAAGLAFIGPPPGVLAAMGDKVAARRLAGRGRRTDRAGHGRSAARRSGGGGRGRGADRLSAALEGCRGWGREGDAGRCDAGRASRRRWSGREAKRRRRSATAGCTPSGRCSDPGTSRCRYSPIRTATCAIWASAIVACSGAFRS